jgi:spermidine synthase
MFAAMTRPWRVLAKVEDEQGVLELRQRGDDFLIVIDGRVLMNSHSRRSEEELSRLGLAHVTRPAVKQSRRGHDAGGPLVLIAGLGMGFTLRAALDVLPADARVVVCELSSVVVEWCKGPLAEPTGHAVHDPRVKIELQDVAHVIARARHGSYDAILLDLYEGPNSASQRGDDPFYGPRALEHAHAALRAGGVLSVWSEDADAPFEKRFAAKGFAVDKRAIGQGGRKHIVYVGRRLPTRGT